MKSGSELAGERSDPAERSLVRRRQEIMWAHFSCSFAARPCALQREPVLRLSVSVICSPGNRLAYHNGIADKDAFLSAPGVGYYPGRNWTNQHSNEVTRLNSSAQECAVTNKVPLKRKEKKLNSILNSFSYNWQRFSIIRYLPLTQCCEMVRQTRTTYIRHNISLDHTWHLAWHSGIQEYQNQIPVRKTDLWGEKQSNKKWSTRFSGIFQRVTHV